MDRETLLKNMKAMKAKAKAARKAGKAELAATFKNSSSRLLRKLKGLPKPPAAKPAEG